MNELLQLVDIIILSGHREYDQQEILFAEGKSKLRGGESKHNQTPSLAVDFAPFPIDWKDTERFAYVAGIAMGIAKRKDLKLRWGGDWNLNGILSDNRFNDLGHLELVI